MENGKHITMPSNPTLVPRAAYGKRYLVMKRALKVIASILAIVVVGYVAFVVYVDYVVFDDPFDNKRFDKKVWLEHYDTDMPNNPRGEMLSDLIKNHLSVGLKKQQIDNLLGTPEHVTDDGVYLYNLGMWSGFGIDYDYLYVYFDENNNVSSFKRVQH